VHERIAERLDDVFVDFRFTAEDFEFGILAELAGEVADHPRKTLKGFVHRDHAHTHGRFAKPFRQAVEVFGEMVEVGVVLLGGLGFNTRFQGDELAGQVEKGVDLVALHADRFLVPIAFPSLDKGFAV